MGKYVYIQCVRVLNKCKLSNKYIDINSYIDTCDFI